MLAMFIMIAWNNILTCIVKLPTCIAVYVYTTYCTCCHMEVKLTNKKDEKNTNYEKLHYRCASSVTLSPTKVITLTAELIR